MPKIHRYPIWTRRKEDIIGGIRCDGGCRNVANGKRGERDENEHLAVIRIGLGKGINEPREMGKPGGGGRLRFPRKRGSRGMCVVGKMNADITELDGSSSRWIMDEKKTGSDGRTSGKMRGGLERTIWVRDWASERSRGPRESAGFKGRRTVGGETYMLPVVPIMHARRRPRPGVGYCPRIDLEWIVREEWERKMEKRDYLKSGPRARRCRVREGAMRDGPRAGRGKRIDVLAGVCIEIEEHMYRAKLAVMGLGGGKRACMRRTSQLQGEDVAVLGRSARGLGGDAGAVVVVADKKHNACAQPLDPCAMVGAGVEPRKGEMGAEQRRWNKVRFAVGAGWRRLKRMGRK
ncbi:hypothetical protein DFH08DRAFT_810232 [Mycena albidolilacea]|uniref:Uncharacterized protein n=1 Tax=Mycena albidolilacea TaxID=1033008 RepID=A0AAD6ZZ60_9AGAR|nr:hypothetical protein DFH08DRAFT_810232 [Mycena albidolilacea]